MYAGMVLMCVLTSILLLLGYLAFYSSMLAFLFSVKDFILILIFGVLNSSDILPVSCSMSLPFLISPNTIDNITEGVARGDKITDFPPGGREVSRRVDSEFNQWFTGFTDG
jgi:hypothetical protein